MQRKWILCVVALLLLVSGADAAYTYTSWEHDLNTSVSAVDTNEYGTVTFIGTANTLYCYNLIGNETWNLTVNGTPQKIVSTQDGDRALLYTDNDIVYYVNGTDGDVVAEYQMAGVGRAKDVTMKKDGQVFAFAYENTTYVVDDVSSAVIGTPYSWYEIPVTTGTWHKLAYQATNDILTLSKTGESRVYMVNATRIPYHIPVTVNNTNEYVDTDIIDRYVYVNITSEPLFHFLHDGSAKLEIWSNWSASDGYTDHLNFDIETWNVTTHTMQLCIGNVTLMNGNATTLYFRNNVNRIATDEISIDTSVDSMRPITILHDEFDDDIIDPTVWSTQPVYNYGTVVETGGWVEFKNGLNGYGFVADGDSRSGLVSTRSLHSDFSYIVNITWVMSCSAYSRVNFTYGVANPATVGYNVYTVTNNSLVTSGFRYFTYDPTYGSRYLGSSNVIVTGDDGNVVTSATPYTITSPWYTTVTEYNLRDRTVSTKVFDQTGTLINTFAQQSYGLGDLTLGDDLRLFITGGSHHHAEYNGYSVVERVDVAIVIPEVVTTSVGTYNPFADHHDVTGVIQYMDFPESGEWLAVAAATTSSPVNGYVHHIYVPASGFSTTYTAQTTGNSYDLKAADGCAFSIDAREITIEINRLDGIPVGTYTTGGSLTSVDIAMKNGLWAVAGSTDGKFYVFSKDATSGWYQDHASDSEESVTCVAMSWRGEMVVVGRSDGSVLMYPTGGGTEDDDDDTTDTTFPAQITVFQDGRLAVGKTVVIEKSETSNPYTWTAYATEQTDAQGKVVIPDADNGAFYKLTVDEKETVYAASSTSPQLTISVMTPIINGQWEFEAVYDEDTNIITGSYTDVEPAQSITIRIVNTNTKQLVAKQTVYNTDQLIVTVAGNPEYVYKVDVDATRFTGNQIRMSKIVHTASIYNIPLGDLDVHMKNAIFTIIIMAVGGLFSYAHSTKGGLLLVALAGGFALFGFTTVSYAVIGIAGFVAIISILIRGTRR